MLCFAPSYLLAMTVPEFRLLELPLRRTSVTVPCVVGFHCRVKGLPPFAAMPASGMMKGLGFCASATRGAARSARTVRKYIVFCGRTVGTARSK